MASLQGAYTVKRAFVSCGQETKELVAAVTGKQIVVLSFTITSTTATATAITFKSATTAISPVLTQPGSSFGGANRNPDGWFETAAGAALNVVNSVNANADIGVTYIEVPL